jgi:hypothetical protein
MWSFVLRYVIFCTSVCGFSVRGGEFGVVVYVTEERLEGSQLVSQRYTLRWKGAG